MIVFLIFLKQELICAQKGFGKILQNILFFLISCATFFLLSQNLATQGSSAVLNTFLTTNIIWFALLFSMLFANNDFLCEELRDGTLEQMIIFCPNLEIYILAKIIAAWIIFCLPILLTIPFLMWLLGLNSQFIAQFFVLALLASLTINFICAFCGSLNVAGNKTPLIAILTLPLAIPILLIACASLTGKALEDIEFYSALRILGGLCVFLGAILTVATAKVVKIVNE